MKRYDYLQLAACLVGMVTAVPPFPSDIRGQQWVRVGYLNMSDPAQQCPIPWKTISSRALCGKKTRSGAYCDSLQIVTNGARYKQVCGRFKGYQIGTPDAFYMYTARHNIPDIETYYVDGISITYGSPGNRRHVFTYAAGETEQNYTSACPCAGGMSPPQLVGSDYYCESTDLIDGYYDDVLWDGQQCGNSEVECCSRPSLPWFCKTFNTTISEDLEVRICTDEDVMTNENVALESFELYILRKLNVLFKTFFQNCLGCVVHIIT